MSPRSVRAAGRTTRSPPSRPEAATGELVASVGLHFDRGRDDGTAEIGYWCSPSARGRGYVPEAVAAIAQWGFSDCGVERLEWYAVVGNDASRRAAEKVGFVVEGALRRGLVHRGVRVDAWVGSLLPCASASLV